MRAVRDGRVEHFEDQINALRVTNCESKPTREHAIRSTKKQNTLQKLHDKKKDRENGAFTACTVGISLLETVTDAAEIAGRMATIMLSTARSSFDELQNARKCGQNLYILAKSISWGRDAMNPYKCGATPLIGI
jgi:UDP-N-acetylmuramoylalanine-D-glutamate ligase